MAFDDEEGQYLALVNDEGQHSLWPKKLPIPPGWIATGTEGLKQVCLDYIEGAWTDMRPVSLRN